MTKRIILTFAFLCGAVLYTGAYNQDDNSVRSAQMDNKVSTELSLEAFAPVSLEFNEFSLQADSASLLHNMRLQFSVLSDNQLASMPGDMVNVMGELANGYRLEMGHMMRIFKDLVTDVIVLLEL